MTITLVERVTKMTITLAQIVTKIMETLVLSTV